MVNVIKYSVINSLSTFFYVVFVASLMFFVGNNHILPDHTVLIPIGMLMLFVFSAALVGTLVFGRPILLYLDNNKREAVMLLVYTLVFLLIMTTIVFFSLSMLG